MKKVKTLTQLRWHVLQDFPFSIHILHVYFKTGLHLACVKHYPKANCPEYNERAANLQPC